MRPRHVRALTVGRPRDRRREAPPRTRLGGWAAASTRRRCSWRWPRFWSPAFPGAQCACVFKNRCARQHAVPWRRDRETRGKRRCVFPLLGFPRVRVTWSTCCWRALRCALGHADNSQLRAPGLPQIQGLIDANAGLIQKAKANESKDATSQNLSSIQVAPFRPRSLSAFATAPQCMRASVCAETREAYQRSERADSGEGGAQGE